MRKKTFDGLLLLAVLIFVFLFIECGKGADDDSEDDDSMIDSDDSDVGDDVDDDSIDDDADDDYTDPECETNIDPVLISVSAFVNGEPVEFPFTAYETDEIIFSFEYDDPDCNLIVDGEGGGIDFRDGGTYALGRLPDDSPCSTVEVENPVDVDLDLISRLGWGEHQGWIYINDKCGRSNELYLEFNLPFTG
jgi:hypothetical protein